MKYTYTFLLPDGQPFIQGPTQNFKVNMKHRVEIDETQRQLIIMALAELSHSWPGLDTSIGVTASCFPKGFELYGIFQAMQADAVLDALGTIGEKQS
jgi:hypothetical protein